MQDEHASALEGVRIDLLYGWKTMRHASGIYDQALGTREQRCAYCSRLCSLSKTCEGCGAPR